MNKDVRYCDLAVIYGVNRGMGRRRRRKTFPERVGSDPEYCFRIMRNSRVTISMRLFQFVV
jgi:hypothetical protein